MGDLDWGLAMAMGTVNCNALHVLAGSWDFSTLVKQLLTNFTNETAELLSSRRRSRGFVFCAICQTERHNFLTSQPNSQPANQQTN